MAGFISLFQFVHRFALEMHSFVEWVVLFCAKRKQIQKISKILFVCVIYMNVRFHYYGIYVCCRMPTFCFAVHLLSHCFTLWMNIVLKYRNKFSNLFTIFILYNCLLLKSLFTKFMLMFFFFLIILFICCSVGSHNKSPFHPKQIRATKN